MATVLITGCAGFIGSQLAAACLARGDRVIGADLFTDNYDVSEKRSNQTQLSDEFDALDFRRVDLADGCDDLVDGVDVVFHLAGQPGVRESWRDRFDDYVRQNVLATQRVLEASRRAGVSRVVYASSSSVYGNCASYPVDESIAPQPFSPYGVTKLAAENMCSLYAENFGLSVVSLRYFTVYGPRQRPDMAIRRMIDAAHGGAPFTLFGSGEQERDFTFVDDVVNATLLAGDADVKPGLVANISGGSVTTMNDLADLIGDLIGRPVPMLRRSSVHGDVIRTGAVIDVASTQLGWLPTVDLTAGLRCQIDWQSGRFGPGAP